MPSTVPRTRLAALLALALLGGCRERVVQQQAAAPRPHDDFLPSRTAYAGSEACAECHQKNHDRWQHSWHARALSPANEKDVVGNFAGAHFRGDSSEAWMRRRGETFVMRTRDR